MIHLDLQLSYSPLHQESKWTYPKARPHHPLVLQTLLWMVGKVGSAEPQKLIEVFGQSVSQIYRQLCQNVQAKVQASDFSKVSD